VGDAVRSLLAVLFPSDCRFCQSLLTNLSRLPVCNSCLESIQPILLPRCNICGDLLGRAEAQFGDARCQECSAEEPAFARAVNFGSYTGALRQLVHLLKYERVRPAAQVLGRLTVQACLQLEGDIDVAELLLIPVPVHKSRMRSRGFNQAELIARAAHRGIEEAIGRRLTLDSTTLLRTRFAESQVALTADARRQQIRGAFKVTARERIKGREVLLIDDVLTTGATASECARELLHAGAARVWVATPARALSRVAQESIAEDIADIKVPYGLSASQPFRPALVEASLQQRHGILLSTGEQGASWRQARARGF
jgi:ComF family protein